ncbi:MAG: dTDP-4-dehydrorhamnose 3,5-epimerase family protein [Candidatus Cloacimonetes bacterium]|nr:dTDP-4-dehydrorhamnose 3,5-epimerase family protein [Candidatus Cloacimonadota bacterium]
MKEPKLIKGDITIDDRGEVSFVNDFDFDQVKRFYMIKNHKQNFIRAWHGHKNESKYFTVVKGTVLICGVEVNDWQKPSKDLKIHRFILSEKKPSVLYLPKGYANGFMLLTEDAKLMVFSTSKLEDSLNDDIRFDSHYWNPWEIKER